MARFVDGPFSPPMILPLVASINFLIRPNREKAEDLSECFNDNYTTRLLHIDSINPHTIANLIAISIL